jgi:hypothetical protein
MFMFMFMFMFVFMNMNMTIARRSSSVRRVFFEWVVYVVVSTATEEEILDVVGGVAVALGGETVEATHGVVVQVAGEKDASAGWETRDGLPYIEGRLKGGRGEGEEVRDGGEDDGRLPRGAVVEAVSGGRGVRLTKEEWDPPHDRDR